MLGLTLLLNTATQAMDRLCLLRMAAGGDVLTPEYRDPSLLLRQDGTPCAAQEALAEQLGRSAAQLRVVGAVASTAAILARPETGRRLTALLALAAAGAWEPVAELPRGGQLHRRTAADGQVYLLAGAPDRGAAHAPHAMRGYAERLWILPPGHPADAVPAEPATLAAEGPDSLSLQAALRDLTLQLMTAGQDALAARLAALGQSVPLPAAPVAAPREVPAAA